MKKQSIFSAIAKSAGYALLFIACQTLGAFVGEGVILVSLLGEGLPPEEISSRIMDAVYGMIYEINALGALVFLGILLLMKMRALSTDLLLKEASPFTCFSAVIAGLGSFFAANILMSFMALLPAVQASQEQYMEQQEAILAAGGSPWAEVIYVCLLGPFVEELLCRGAILSCLKKSMLPGYAILISGLIFALIHGNLYQVVFTLPLGILLGYLTHRSRSLLPAFLLHAVFNSTNYLIRIGSLFGFSEDSDLWSLCAVTVLLFCGGCLVIGIFTVKVALDKEKPTAPLFQKEEPVFAGGCPSDFAPDPRFFSSYSSADSAPSCASAPYPPQAAFAPPSEASKANIPTESTPNFNPSNASRVSVEKAQGVYMAAPEYMIVGLGNPEPKYAANRHNCGFIALDYIAHRQGIDIRNLRFRALTAETLIQGKKVLLLKPQTFMNSSGEAVREAAAFYKIPPEKILVIFDDISFAPGVFRIRKSGSAGGHNGIKSIIACLNSDAFPRLKMGVGVPPEGMDLINWVLGNFSREDMAKITASLEDVYASAQLFAEDRIDLAIAQFNGKAHG
ncbi:MAG: aminoacyl-tRNA hydrolase [Clostridia bacterium]|nr:aminoacyl-tRNA hydrolase [Clostridia bacterium]